MNKKRVKIILCICSISFVSILCIFKYNPYIRTDIFRSIAKGNWYIITENDTIYSIGYFGITKYLIKNNGQIETILKNENICEGRLFGRSGCIVDNNIYVITRSYIPGADKTDELAGELIILRKDKLSEIIRYPSDIKLTEIHKYNNNIVVSGINGFNIYNINNSNKPKLIFKHRTKKYREYQGFDIFQYGDSTYVAFSLFCDGIEIWNISMPQKPRFICDFKINENYKNRGKVIKESQCMDIVASYPFLYATIGPLKKNFKDKEGLRGIIQFDISNIKNIKAKIVEIPRDLWYNKATGDCQPTYICKDNNYIYTNFGEKGVAIFSIDSVLIPKFIGLNDISGCNALIQPLNVSKNGYIIVGDYYWNKIYLKNKYKTK